MKKIFKIFITTAITTVMLASTCFAQELTKVMPDLTEEQFIAQTNAHQATALAQAASIENSMADKNAAAAHRNTILSQLKSYNRSEADNYILYRQKRVAGLKETERIKKEVYDNYVNLSRSNSSFAGAANTALADYNNAIRIRMAEEAAVSKITADFNVLYPR